MRSTQIFKDEHLKDPKAYRIWEEIITSYNTYTNDSAIVRFFLPEQLVLHCRPVAAAFTSLPYTPTLDPEKIYTTSLYYIFLLSTVCGVQIYLKEQALANNFSPYTIEVNDEEIKYAKEKALLTLSQGAKLPVAPEQVMRKFIAQFLQNSNSTRFTLKGKTFAKERYDYLLPASVFWGYFFAKEMIK